MRINNNLMALNTHRQLGVGNTNSSKSMEKLSSGLRINRAGDDAAGLSISEKMRSQIRGLNQASRNSQDGISLIQTAEGALQETHSILQRMRELAVQAANDTNASEDREAIQEEMDQLVEEIDRIGNTTQFNKKKILNGGEAKAAEGAEGAGDAKEAEAKAAAAILEGTDVSGEFGNKLDSLDKMSLNGQEVALTNTKALDGTTTALTIDDIAAELQKDIDAVYDGAAHDGVKFTVGKNADGNGLTITSSVEGKDSKVELTANASTAKLKLTADDSTDASAVGKDAPEEAEKAASGLEVSDNKKANAAIDTIENAIKMVSKQRSKLGAYQNRLEHTIKNLDTSSENLQAAESRIRDVDMAKEMMNLTKNKILQQAATAMLAQANQAPQGVLQLLR